MFPMKCKCESLPRIIFVIKWRLIVKSQSGMTKCREQMTWDQEIILITHSFRIWFQGLDKIDSQIIEWQVKDSPTCTYLPTSEVANVGEGE